MSRMTKQLLVVLGCIILTILCAVAAGVYWGTGPALRCELPTAGSTQPGWTARRLTSGAIERCYYLYTPSGYDPAEPLPVVMSLHGFLSNPESHALITGWHKLAEEEHFLVVYPQGTGFPRRWNAAQSWGSPADDEQFLRDILSDLPTIANVDSARIYLNGFSNGGGMTVRAGCAMADRIAALGTVAAAVVSLDGCDPSRPLAHIAFQGTEDPLVQYEGGKHRGPIVPTGARITQAPREFAAFGEWTRAWAMLNGCDPLPQPLSPKGDVNGARYVNCRQDAEVWTYVIDRGGHTWPGGWPIPGLGKTSSDIDATKQMWQFFQAYRLED